MTVRSWAVMMIPESSPAEDQSEDQETEMRSVGEKEKTNRWLGKDENQRRTGGEPEDDQKRTKREPEEDQMRIRWQPSRRGKEISLRLREFLEEAFLRCSSHI